MKKITTTLFCFLFFLGFSQTKTTGVINLTSNMTADFTLDNDASLVTLVLTGPSDRWFSLGIGVINGFAMSDGDAIIYTTTFTDRNYIGTASPKIDVSQDWTVVSNTVASVVRTLTLERALTNTDLDDFQLSYESTNTIDLAWAKAPSATTNLGYHQNNRGFATATFTTLGKEDFSLEATSLYPNPVSGDLYIITKTNLSKVNIYGQTGALIKSIEIKNYSNEHKIDVNDFQSGIYFIELQNDSEKSWKKIIVK